MDIHIGLMGPIAVTSRGEDVTPTQPKLRQLLALLALEDGAAVSSDVIARELWSAAPSPRNGRIVQTYVSQLRGLLSGGQCSQPARIRNVPRVGYHLTLDDQTTCDVERVQNLSALAGTRLAESDKEGAVGLFEEALGLCRGMPLGGVPVGPVLSRRRKRLEALRMSCFEQTLRIHIELGRPELALAYYERVVAEDVHHEPLYALLVTALGATGRMSSAVDLFHDVRRDVVARTGMEPGEMLQQAFLAVVQSSGGGRTPDRAAPPGRRPAGRPAGPAPAQLPFAPTAFVGFAAELAAARGVLARRGGPAGGSALMVVGGPGSGKSTFCTQLAHQVRGRYPGGQLYADLRTRNVADTLREFIVAMGGDSQSLPGSLVERSRMFRRMTAQLPLLVVLDNVVDVGDVCWLQPGCEQGSMILACRRRCWADFVTGTVELREATSDELMAMLVSRIGADTVAREPAAARSVVALAFGLPVAIMALTTLLRSRPHWTLQRLVDRLTGEMGSRIELALGYEQLAAIVESTLDLMPSSTREVLLRVCQTDGCDRPFSTATFAEMAGLRMEDAEQAIEDAVAVRIADPVAGSGNPRLYSLNILYRAATLEWYRRWQSTRTAAPTGDPAVTHS